MNRLMYILYSMVLLAQAMFWTSSVSAQVQITTHVMPPYHPRITDYISSPQQMLVTLTNTLLDVPLSVQLTASLEGDGNGVSVKVKPGFRSSSAIVLQPGQTVTLNGTDIALLFQVDNLALMGIRKEELVRGEGFKEGTYRMCVQALDYYTHQPLSPEMTGCATFRISHLDPPRILNPFNEQVVDDRAGQLVRVAWTTPPGSSPVVQYTVKIVEMPVPRNPNDAVMTTRPLHEEIVNSNMMVYGPQHPPLIQGRQYAMVVQAKDPTGRSTFRNRGMSEAISFTYGESPTPINAVNIAPQPPGAPQAPLTPSAIPRSGAVPDCASCKVNMSAGGTVVQQLDPGTVVKVNHFDMNVLSVSASENGLFSGTGTIVLPKLGDLSKEVKLRVQFDRITIKEQGGQRRMTEGMANGIVRSDFGFMPAGTPPELTTIPLNAGQINQLDQYFRDNSSQMLSNIENSVNSVGFELPLGLDKGAFTIGVTDVFFSPTQSWFEAVSVMNMTDAGTKVAFSGRGICLKSNDFCREAQLYLSDDITVGNTGLKIKGKNGETFLKFDNKGYKEMSISAGYTFPVGTLTSAASGEPSEAEITAVTTGGWNNWIGQARVKPFKIGVSNDFIFGKGDTDVMLLYDHSDVEIARYNNVQMPDRFESGDPDDAPIVIRPDWTGFYIPEVTVQLPQGIGLLHGGRLELVAKELIYEEGISGKIESGKLVELGDGSLDGWYASVDAVGLQFWKNSLKSGYMNGRLVLPASGSVHSNTANQIDYTCNLTKPANSDLQFEMKATPKNGLNFSAFWTTVDISSASKITVSKRGQDKVEAKAELHGSMVFKTDIKHLPDLTLGSLTFEGMKLSSQPDYFDPGLIKFQTGGGQSAYLDQNGLDEMYAFSSAKGPSAETYTTAADFLNSSTGSGSIIGFSITETKVSPYISGKNIGFSFAGSLQLVKGVNFIPKANVGFSVYGDIGEIAEGKRKVWTAVRGKLDSVRLDAGAKLGPVDVQGSIFYQNMDRDYALSGRLSAVLPAMGGGISMQALFGSRKLQNDKFNYFYLDASLELPSPGITMFPGTALYGFAGGFYYNMNIKEPNRDGTTLPIKNMGANNVNKDIPQSIQIVSFSGNTYTVQNKSHSSEPSDFGIMAGVYFGLSSRNTLEGLLAMDIGLNTAGGFNHFILDGKIAVMTGNQATFKERHQKAMVQGGMKLKIMMDQDDGKFKSFSAEGDYAVKFPNTGLSFMSGRGNIAFYIDRDSKWYFHLGKPTNPNSMEFFSFIKTKSYFQIGNYEIDGIPPIPPRIQELVGQGDRNMHKEEDVSSMNNGVASNKSSRNEGAMDQGLEFNFGANVEISARPQFLIFYADIYAALGFDMSVKEVTQGNASCGQRPGDWYARGQAYVGAEAGCGVRVKVFGIRKEIEFVRAGLAATMEAGAPAPLYATGNIGGRFSVLGGLVKGSFNIKATLGKPCVENSSRELKLISDLTPGERDISIYSKPAVAFNYPLDWDFVVPITQVNNKDEVTGVNYEVYRLKYQPDYITIRVTRNGQTVFTNQDFTMSERDRYAVRLNSDEALHPLSEYKIDASAKVKILTFSLFGGAHTTQSQARAYADAGMAEPMFQFVRTASKKIYTDDRDTLFSTDTGPKRIELAQLTDIMPIHRHRAMPFASIPNNMAYLHLEKNTPLDRYDHKLQNARPWIRIVTMSANNEADKRDVPITLSSDNRRWSFNMPALLPNKEYAVRIFLKGDMPPSPPADNNMLTTLVSAKTYMMGGATATVSNRKIMENSLEMAKNEHEMFSWYFNTGQYRTYDDKMKGMKLEKMTVDGKDIDIHTPEVNLSNFTGETVGSLIGYSLYYFGPEYFNVMDRSEWTVGEVFPDVGNGNKSKVLGNKNYVGFLGVTPYIAPPAGYQDAIDQFMDTAFRGQKKFADNIFRTEWNATVGAFTSSSFGGFSNPSPLLPHDMYGINYRGNTYRTQQPDTYVESNTAANAEKTEGTKVAGIILNSYEVKNLVPIGLQGVVFGNQANKQVYSFSVTMDYQPGKGVVNASNILLQKIQLKTGQGYPTDMLKPMGVMMDQMTKSLLNTPVQVPPIGNTKTPAIRLR